MAKKRLILIVFLLSTSIFLSACSPGNPLDDNGNANDNSDLQEEIAIRDKKIEELEEANSGLIGEITLLEERIVELEGSVEQIEGDNDSLLVTMAKVVELLEEEDMEGLKDHVHPDKGLRFSAYPYVDLEEDIVLMKDEIVDAYNSSETHIWGETDGEGADIDLSFKDYFEEYVYDEDFLNAPLIGYNRILSGGNTIDNVEEAYPEADFYELYFEGFNEDFAGQDWRSLKLIFENQGGRWYLVGITHGQWTI